MAEHSHQRLHKMVTFNSWIDIKTLSVANIPLEVIYQILSRDPENKDKTVLTLFVLGSSSVMLGGSGPGPREQGNDSANSICIRLVWCYAWWVGVGTPENKDKTVLTLFV